MLNEGLFLGVKVRAEEGRADTFVPRGVPSEEVEKKRGSVLRRTVTMIERRLKKKQG